MTATIGDQRIAECLYLLNDRQIGTLTRLYHMKTILESSEHRPIVMPGCDKSYDNAWKVLLRKFPSVEFKSGQSALQPFIVHQKDIMVLLSPFYYNFVEALYIKDHFSDLLSRIGCCDIHFDMNVNPDLTRLYLELITNHFAMMLFITRISDTKAILALFNFFFDQLYGKSEPDYPRMSELFTETPEAMLKELHRSVNPYSRTISKALNSLDEFFVRRTVRAQNWTDGHFLDILHEPSKVAHTVFGDRLICELIPYEMMERWIVFCYLLIYPELKEETAFNRLKLALRNSYVVVLFRDEVVNVHNLFQTFLESPWTQKVGAKRITEIKETFMLACTQAPEVHSDRRSYLRFALRQLNLVLSDEPGLLGPKAFLVFWALSYATDEIHWLLRHLTNPVPKKSALSSIRSVNNISMENQDPFMPELLFYIDELRLLVSRYAHVIQRFYLQYLARADAGRLTEHLGQMQNILPEEQFIVLNKAAKELSQCMENKAAMDHAQGSDGKYATPNFQGFRLDWLRLQVIFSSKSSPIDLSSHSQFIEEIHSIVFHTRLVDFIDELLRSVSDLSVFIFYSEVLTICFEQALNLPNQLRFVAIFPSVCCHAVQACHSMCPEERGFLGHKSSRLARHYFQVIAARISKAVLVRIDDFGELGDQLAPQKAVRWLSEEKSKKKWKKAPNNGIAVTNGVLASSKVSGVALNASVTPRGEFDKTDDKTMPGYESYRRDRVEQTKYDKALFNLTQLCQSINHNPELIVADDLLQPREILHLELQSRFITLLSTYPVPSLSSSQEQSFETLVTKPSELLRRVRSLMNVLMDLENHVSIDVVAIFSTVFAHQSQLRDGFKGQATMTSHYCNWYREQLIKHAYKDHFVFSPLLRSFVTMVPADVVRFRAEDYADLNELCALAQLIGPLGIRELCDQLLQDVGERIEKLHSLVLQNRSSLEKLRGCFDDPIKTRQLSASLLNTDSFLQLLKEIGVVLAFKHLCFEALNTNLEVHIPFLMDSIKHLRSHLTRRSGGQLLPVSSPNPRGDSPDDVYTRFNCQLAVTNLSDSVGIRSDLDYSLCAMLNNRQIAARNAALQAGVANPDLDYNIACLLVVFMANGLPVLARREDSFYHVELDANENNSHCIAYAINALMVAMFSLFRPGDLEARSQEFLALASSNLLRLGLEPSSSLVSADVHGGGSSGNQGAQSQLSNSDHGAPLIHRDSIYILFDNLVRQSPCLSHTVQEACFPYSLIRSAYQNVAKLAVSAAPGKQTSSTKQSSLGSDHKHHE